MADDSKKTDTAIAMSVAGLEKRFKGNYVLRGVSFELRAGKITGMIGPNGAGKTTCFNCITGNLKPTAGDVRFQGRKITGLKPNQMYDRGVHRTFQIPGPVESMSLVENVILARRQQRGD